MRISDWSSDVCSSDLTLSRNDPPFPSPASAAAPPVQDNGFSPSSKRSERPVHRLPEQRRVVRAVLEAHDLQVVDVRAFEQVQRGRRLRSAEHTSELQSLMRISYAVFCLKTKNRHCCTYHS